MLTQLRGATIVSGEATPWPPSSPWLRPDYKKRKTVFDTFDTTRLVAHDKSSSATKFTS